MQYVAYNIEYYYIIRDMLQFIVILAKISIINNYKIQKALQVDCSHYTVLYLLENYSNNTIIILIFVRLFFSEMLYDIYTMSTNMIFTRY